MMRRLFVWCTVLACLVLPVSPRVQAQGCQVTTNGSLGLPNYPILLPDELAAQGGLTGTVTAIAADANGNPLSGAVPSHRVTVTPGTRVNLPWTSSSNAVSAVNWFTVNNGPPQNKQSVALNSTAGYWLLNSSEVGNTYTLFFSPSDSSGNSTIDKVAVTVVAGSGPSVVFQDDFPINYYLELADPFNGGTSMNQGTCQGASQAHHTAFEFGSFTNPTSGETQSFNTNISFCPNCTFNEGVPPLYISWLPNDAPPKTTTTGKLECTIAGTFFGLVQATGDSTKNQRVDKKMWTKVWAAQSSTDGGWYTADWCIEKEVPIWSPNEIYSSEIPLFRYWWTAQTCSSSPLGTDPGPGWHCPEASGGPGGHDPEKFFPSATSTKGSCNTNINTPAPY